MAYFRLAVGRLVHHIGHDLRQVGKHGQGRRTSYANNTERESWVLMRTDAPYGRRDEKLPPVPYTNGVGVWIHCTQAMSGTTSPRKLDAWSNNLMYTNKARNNRTDRSLPRVKFFSRRCQKLEMIKALSIAPHSTPEDALSKRFQNFSPVPT